MARKNHHRRQKHNYSIFDGGRRTIDDLPGASSQLCDECRSLGYCKLRKPGETSHVAPTYQASVLKKVPFNIEYYKNKISFRVSSHEGFSASAKQHLQVAYDSFHQEDYETALLNFKSVERGGTYNDGRDYFLAVTNFLLGRYREASLHMQLSAENTYYREEDFSPFLDECERRDTPNNPNHLERAVLTELNFAGHPRIVLT